MPIADEGPAEESVAIAALEGAEEGRPESSEAEAASPPTSPASSTTSELHRRLNRAVGDTLVDAEFSDSVFNSPSRMQPEAKSGANDGDATKEAVDSENEGTPKLRRSSRLIAAPSNGNASAAPESGRRRRPEASSGDKKKTTPRNGVPKKRKASVNSVASDLSNMGMPLLEAADPIEEHATTAATATAELEETTDSNLAQLLAAFVGSNGVEKAEVTDGEDDDEEPYMVPLMTPPPTLTACVDDSDDDCNCRCCRKMERHIASLSEQMAEMMNLLQKLVRQQKPQFPAVTLKDALSPLSKQPLPRQKEAVTSFPKTIFRPASKDEISQQCSSTSSALSRRSRNTASADKRCHSGSKKPKLSEDDDDQSGFAHFNDDGTPTQKYLWKLRNIGPANALFRSSSTELIIEILHSMTKAGLLRCLNKNAQSKMDLQFEKVANVPAEALEPFDLNIDEYLKKCRIPC
ncbi:hypothetical protein QR680_012786 [Steinernema hermaphroditum]|uniref:Uncharacterized protein n=1 Tax=Steinernema hermaphroditum TaxID=289476 RepID=A0AA39I368_9BILA|nr:hypothetical protein QR680_012786 [Steinernema hermaphroditum]